MTGRIRRAVRATLLACVACLLLSRGSQAQVPARPAVPATPDSDADVQEPVPAAASGLSTMRIRGYADVGFGSPLQEKLPPGGLQRSKSSFQIADFHLFITAKLSEDWSALAETLVTSDFSNEFSVEMDRLIIQYSPNKFFRVGFGKFNTGIGYYPNQFHRAKFYQTATGRPLMFTDEDNGGILPVHQVGVTAQGEIPSGSVGLHYIAEITNGRSFGQQSAEVQNFADENNFKAVNVGLSIHPDAVPALDLGFSVYRDTVENATVQRMSETITALHAVYSTPNFEFLNEAVVLAHRVAATGITATSKGAYSQISQRFGIVRPYFRFEYQDVPLADPVFGVGDVAVAFGVRKALSAGVHFDLGDFAVVKAQYDHALQHEVWANGAHVQLAFAF